MKSRGTVYIAGPMRGHPGFNFPAFYKAEAMLQLWGYTVINPARMDIEEGKATFNSNMGEVIADNSFTIEDALRRDFQEILGRAQAIVALPGWQSSIGANREIAFANSIGQHVFLFDPERPLDINRDQPLDLMVAKHIVWNREDNV